jgi:hypothetical protein
MGKSAEKQPQSAKRKTPGRPFAKGDDPRRAKGRPPIGKALAERARAVLEERDPAGDGEARLDAILRRLARDAAKGHVASAALLFERAYGRAEAPITGADGGPVRIIVEYEK